MKYLISALALILSISAQAQDSTRWRVTAGVGQYAAKLGLPSFGALHLGGQLGASYRLNKGTKHQLQLSGTLAGFYHRNFQKAWQAYSELQYELHFGKLSITPMALGGGYVASVSDMSNFEWDGNQYVAVSAPTRHNFLVSIGSTVGCETPFKIASKPVSLWLAYRMQVQGIIIQNAVPVVAYSSLQLGASLPF
jgi:hypothetical protein